MAYLDAGFNKFFCRSIASNKEIASLKQASFVSGNTAINFDQVQTSGSLGDKIQIGGIIIDGTNRRIVIQDENGIAVGWIGNLDV